jgi:hypothetical protein
MSTPGWGWRGFHDAGREVSVEGYLFKAPPFMTTRNYFSGVADTAGLDCSVADADEVAVYSDVFAD